MDLLSARQMANSLLEFHGLKDQGWRFAFDDSVSHFGCCSYREKVIYLSRPMTLTITEDKTKDTILHEVAHGLCPGHNHDDEWKRVAKSIGCRGERCGNITKEAIDETRLEKFKKYKYNYTYTCPTCGNITYSNKLYRMAYCNNNHKPINYKIKKN
jgi:hypothetical protein